MAEQCPFKAWVDGSSPSALTIYLHIFHPVQRLATLGVARVVPKFSLCPVLCPPRFGDEVELQYYRLQLIYASPIDLKQGDAQGVKSPSEVGTAEVKGEKAPLSKIIEVLNERFGTQFTEEDRLFFQQIKEKACKNQQIIKTALANPLDRFQMGIRKLIEELMIERMGENDKIVTRYMSDRDFQASAYPILAREIFDAVLTTNPIDHEAQ